MTPIFEHETCSRCHGSGHYSYNQMTGTRCFKCDGAKVSLTKRGRAAQEFYDGLRTITADQVQIGQRVSCMGGLKFTVKEIREGTPRALISMNKIHAPSIMLISVNDRQYCLGPQSPVKIIPTTEQRDQWIKQALEYQSTLTATGKPRKTK